MWGPAISDIETGKRHVPNDLRTIAAISRGLLLAEVDEQRLVAAISKSPRVVRVPPSTKREVFLLASVFRDCLNELSAEDATRLHEEFRRTRP